jgi:hypothetical protein
VMLHHIHAVGGKEGQIVWSGQFGIADRGNRRE